MLSMGAIFVLSLVMGLGSLGESLRHISFISTLCRFENVGISGVSFFFSFHVIIVYITTIFRFS